MAEFLREKAKGDAESRTGSIKPKWTRVNRDENFPRAWSQRDKGEEQAQRDLEKPIEQLLSDIHEADAAIQEEVMAQKALPRDPAVLTIYTHAKTASMMAALAIRSERLTKWIIGLTVVLVVLTLVLIVQTAILICNGG